MSVHKGPAAALHGRESQDPRETGDEVGESSGVRVATRMRSAPDHIPPPSVGAEGVLGLQDFVVLAESAKNPRARAIERLSADFARRAGLLLPQNKARFSAFNSLVGYVYPTATIERAVACNLWCNWLFFFDDTHDEDAAACADLQRVREHMEHYLGLLMGAVRVDSPQPLEKLTIEFRRRALDLAGRAWLSRFSDLVDAYLFRGVLTAVENWRAGRTPPLAEYLEQREHDSAVMTAIDLIELARGISVPDEDRNSPDMLAARRACTRTIACFNDIVSYPKEVIRHRNPNNLVHVLVSERNVSVTEALHQAADIVNDAARELARLEQRIAAEHPDPSDPVRAYLLGMREWQRGNIDSSLEGERYASRWSPMVELYRPDSLR